MGRPRATATGGRDATTRHIPPKLALAVGMPSMPAPKGWQWSALTKLARLESGHTPSRRHPEYWGGSIPWVGIQDARAHDGRRIDDTEEKTNDLGIANSSARVLPKNTVCLSRTASVGYVVVLGCPMATSQDFVNWVCSKDLDHNFLKYLFVAEDEDLLRFASGSVHQTIYFPEAKAFHICHPPLPEQRRIVSILDEAFEGIATAKASAETNLQNTRALLESHVQSVFNQRGNGWVERALGDLIEIQNGYAFKSDDYTDSGHFVIRISNVQDGEITLANPRFIKLMDKRLERFILNDGDILISLTGNIGRVGIIQESHLPAVLNQRVARLTIKGRSADRDFVFRFLSSRAFRESLQEAGHGAAQQNVSTKEIESIRISMPERKEQRRIIEKLANFAGETHRLAGIYERKIAALKRLKRSLLHQAFSGELTKQSKRSVVIPFPIKIPNITTTDLHAGILAAAYDLHEKKDLQKHFGHVKAEKIAHMVEAYVGIDLGRAPIKDAAGPNDYPHQLSVEHRARKAGYFNFKRVDGSGYQVKKLQRFGELVQRTRERLGNLNQEFDNLLELMLPMNTQQAEIFCTVYTAWNNLLLDGAQPSDAEIVLEAREHWHTAKLKISREKFFSAISWLREKSIVPTGKGRKVGARSRQ